MSSASELFYNRRSRTSRSGERGLGHDGVATDRNGQSLRHTFQRRRHSHFTEREDIDALRQPRALFRLDDEPHQSTEISELGRRSSINSGSTASDRVTRLTTTSSVQLPTTVLQARARLLERLRGISLPRNRQQEEGVEGVTSGLGGNDYRDEDAGRNSHESGRTRGISVTGARRDTGSSSSTNILEELASIDDFVDRIRLQLANTRHHSQDRISRTPGLSRDAIGKLLHEDFQPELLHGDTGTQCDCSVCLEGFKEGDALLRLRCGHRFHCACLEPWLRACADCPYCRAKVRV